MRTSLASIALTLVAASGFGVTFSDGTFAPDDWSTVNFGDSGGQTAVQIGAGGNPGPYREITTNTHAAVATGHFNPAWTVDPSETPILGLSASVDLRELVAFGEGMGYGIFARQNGQFFATGGRATGSGASSEVWRNEAFPNLTAGSFTNLTGGPSLDFSLTGGEVTFGLYTWNIGGQGIVIGWDNLNIAVDAVPEPGSMAVLGLGVASFMRRRRSQRKEARS